MAAVNLPTDVLRTFLAVIDLGSFTKAGQLLGRTQPAISLQIRKLEELVGMILMDTSGRNIALTREGESLARYARQLLVMNDEIVARLKLASNETVLVQSRRLANVPVGNNAAKNSMKESNATSHRPNIWNR